MTSARTVNGFRRPPTPLSAPGHLNVFAIRLRRPVTDTDTGWLAGHPFIFFAEVI